MWINYVDSYTYIKILLIKLWYIGRKNNDIIYIVKSNENLNYERYILFIILLPIKKIPNTNHVGKNTLKGTMTWRLVSLLRITFHM